MGLVVFVGFAQRQVPVSHRIETYLKLTSSEIEVPEYDIKYTRSPREPAITEAPSRRLQSSNSAG